MKNLISRLLLSAALLVSVGSQAAQTNVLGGVILPVTSGGTGSSTASGAVTNLGAAPLNNAGLTGTPTAPTPTTGDSSTKIATTAFVANTLSTSPALGGVPTSTTPSSGDSSTKVATTSFVGTAVTNLLASSPTVTNALTISSGSTTSTPLNLNNTAVGGRNWSLFNSGGGLSGIGTVGFYDNTAGATRWYITPSGSTVSTVENSIINNQVGLTYSNLQNLDPTSNSGVDLRMITRNAANSGNAVIDMVKYANGSFSISNSEPSAGNSILLQTTNTQIKMDNSGKVSIGGSTTPFSTLHVASSVGGGAPASSGSTDANVVTRMQASSVGLDFGFLANGTAWIQNRLFNDFSNNLDLQLQPNGGTVFVPKLRLNGATTGGLVLNTVGDSTSAPPIVFGDSRSGTTSSILVSFFRGASQVGSITTTNAATAYNTTSDGRLKTNVVSIGDSGSVLDLINPVTYNWKYLEGQPKGIGFIAQDLFKVCPECVTPGDSGTDIKSPNFKQWSVDFSKLVPYLTAEVKSLRSRTEALELQNLQLKTANDNLKAEVEAIKTKLGMK